MSGNVPWLTPQGAVGYLGEVARSFDERARDGRATEAVRLLADGHESLRLSVERGNERLIRMTERAESAEARVRALEQEHATLRAALRDAVESEEHLMMRCRSDVDYEGAAIHSHAVVLLRSLVGDSPERQQT